jgi:hypothetical protein
MNAGKKVFFCIFSVAIGLLITLGLWGCSTRGLSSHHASINVHLSENRSHEDRLMKYEGVIETMKTWAADSDMYLIQNANDAVALSTFTTNSNADVRECCFKDTLSSDGPMPLQVMCSYDANSSLQIVRIMFAQGYSKEPSERLKKISSDLYTRLVKINEQTYYSIW